jgi:hypothetical protein
MACIVMVDEIYQPTFRFHQPRFTFFRAIRLRKPWRTGIRGTAAGAGRDTERKAWPGPEDDSTVRPFPARNSPEPWPALGHKHMAFSIVAPYPQATTIAVRVKGSRLYIYSTYLGISNCRRHSLAGWTRATEIIHHAPNGCHFPSIFFARVILL